MVRSPGGSPVNSRPSRKIIDSRTASSSATWWTAARAAGDSPSSRASVTGSQCQSGTRDLAVGCLDDLGGFPNCLVPDSGVGVGEGSFGGVQPGGDRRPPLDGDGGAPALVEVADGEDTVLVASLREGGLDFLEELRQPGRCDRGDRLAQSGERQGGHGNQRLVTVRVLGSHPSQSPLTSSNRINRARSRGGVRRR